MAPLLLKAARALTELPRLLHAPRAPRLVMTLLVKDEEDIIEQNLLFHKAQGVDGFIVTDNNSTDRTPEILEKYRRKGWVLDIIKEQATDYAQKAWVDRMIGLAKRKHGADWVINADADEFWYAPGGCLKDAPAAAGRRNILSCEVRNVYPEEGRPFTLWDKTTREVADGEALGLSPYSLFGRPTRKVIHRTDGYLQISMGNHKVAMLPPLAATADIVVYHYNIRSRAQFMQKMINGGKQLEQRKKQHGGRHWRYFYRLYKEGRLEEEYDRVVGSRAYDRLVREGRIRTDCPLPDVFKRLQEQ